MRANSYGRPTPETVSRLRSNSATIYSTQKNGTITLTITAAGAASWAFASSAKPVTKGANVGGSSGMTTSDPTTSSSGGSSKVFVTATGECYHVRGCRYLAKSCIPISLKDAKAGYRPCGVYKPPT